MAKPIRIYRASAGAGKTFMLVYEYIKYLFEAQDVFLRTGVEWRHNAHRQTLAVTFTNKSTAEMKSRIIAALYGLAHGRETLYSGWLVHDVEALQCLENKTKTDVIIQSAATRLLTDVLQDFTSFRVQTIDGFFQQIVRSFAGELNLNTKYQVELDSDSILELAVDNMLDSLNDGDKNELLVWITDFANDKIGDAKSWNPRRDILNLSGLITSEMYMEQRDDAHIDIRKLKIFKANLKHMIGDFTTRLRRLCDEAQTLLSRYGIDAQTNDIFARFALSPFSFNYLIEKDFKVTKAFATAAEAGDAVAWCKKNKASEVSSALVENLTCLAREILEMCKPESTELVRYKTAKYILSHLYILGILNEIDLNVEEICRAHDCVIISSTTDFLNRIIDGADTPFVYEKIGVATDHFMIDEFQDTSRLQWENFKPLIGESVAHGFESMLVGDVKQSIYRWRNGDWRILHHGVETDFVSNVENLELDENFRSSRKIVEFNNHIYERLPQLIDEHLYNSLGEQKSLSLKGIYKATQKVGRQDNDAGYVCCRFFECEKKNDSDWVGQSLSSMVDVLRTMKRYDGVAVLVWENREATLVADCLRENGIPFDSSESLCVADNQAVKLIVAAMRYIFKPYESVYRAEFLSRYVQVLYHRDISADDFDLISYAGYDFAAWEQWLLSDVVAAGFAALKQFPLLRRAQSLSALFDLENIDGGNHRLYVRTFLDNLKEYCQTRNADVCEFLKYWDERGTKVFIPMPADRNTVQIITIFKAKGLEFDTVFVPFLDWNMGVKNRSNIRLMKLDGGTVHDENIGIVPVDLRNASKLLATDFRDGIIEEFMNICLDTLNVLYVATTRAKKSLHINCLLVAEKESKLRNEISAISVSKLLYRILDENTEYRKSIVNSALDHADVFEFGESGEETDARLDDSEVDEFVVSDYPLASLDEVDDRMTLKYMLADNLRDSESVKWGVLMHRLFERILRRSDVDAAVQSLVKNGEIDDEKQSMMLEIIGRVMKHSVTGSWYSDDYTVINEAEIYDSDRQRIFRPDRLMLDEISKTAVVVDYKFGEKTDELHVGYCRQVLNYMTLIDKMGYTPQGYILYVKDMQVDEVLWQKKIQ